jgi:flagellar assembly factor FliW
MSPLDTAAVAMADTDTHETESAPRNLTTISTRFGTFEVDLDKAIDMPQGPIGFTDLSRFALLDVPENPEGPFKLFQALEDNSVTFIVTVLPTESELIDEADLEAACTNYSIRRDNAAFLLITKVSRDAEGGVATTVNLRAPIVVDAVHKVARQAVFTGDRYPMRHPLQ